MPLAFLAFVAASSDADAVNASHRRLVGQNLHYVSDQCEGDGSLQSAGQGTCTQHIDDTQLNVGNRPSGHVVASYSIATRCCAGSGASFSCSSSGSSGCYGLSQTRDQAEALCQADGRRLCTIAELRTPLSSGGCCGSGCSYDNYFVWSSEVCNTYPLNDLVNEAGLECPLTGPHANKYVQIDNNRCVNANSFVDDVNTFLSLSAAIDALKAIHDTDGGVQSSSCQSIVYLPTWAFAGFDKYVLVKGTNLLTSSSGDISYTVNCPPPPP